MITYTPAVLHLITASGTESLGGSIKLNNPKNYCLSHGKFILSRLNEYPLGYVDFGKWNLAKPKTLSPFFPNILLTF